MTARRSRRPQRHGSPVAGVEDRELAPSRRTPIRHAHVSMADVGQQHEHATQHPSRGDILSTRHAAFSDDERLAGSRAVELRPQAPTA